MKRLLVLSAVVVPLSLFTAGCGDTGGSGKPKEGTAQQQQEQKAKMLKQMEEMKAKGYKGGVSSPGAK
jgi:predicted small secreted protein